MKRLMALATGLASTIVYAGLDRAGNVLHEDGFEATGWELPALVAGLAFFAWKQSEKRTEERIQARKEMDGLRVELWQTKRIAEDLDAKLLEAEKLQAAVQRYLDGELTDEEFFRLADHITNPGASKQHDASD
jgi:hypothetical protein